MNGLSFFRRSVPLLLQTEAAECGIACLAMVASYHGHRIDLANLRRRFAVSLKGANMLQMVRTAEALMLAGRPLRIELSALPSIKLPAILHWDFNHFVVLTKVSGNRVVIHDPGRGRRDMEMSEVSKHFTGICLELTPAPGFENKTEKQALKLSQLWTQSIGLRTALLQVFFLSLALEAFTIVSPLFMQLAVDQVVVSNDPDLLTALGLGFLLFVIIQATVSGLRSWAILYIGSNLNLQIMTNLFSKLMRLPLVFFEKRHLGDIISRFNSVDAIQRTLTTTFIEAIVDGLLLIATLAMMLLYSLKLTIVALLAAGLYALARFILFRPLREATEEQLVHGAKSQTSFIETLRGMQSVMLFNRQAQRRAVWQNFIVDLFNARVRAEHLNILYRASNTLIFGIENIVVIWLGALAVLQGGFSLGMLYAFMAYKLIFVTRSTNLIERGIEFRMLSLHAQRVADIALAPAEVENDENWQVVELPHSGLEVKNVSFRYSDHEPYVLKDVNLTVAPGEIVAITGPSGCGKTTLMKVMLGLLPPNIGEIWVGGLNLKHIGAQSFRSLVGAVMQEDQLFSGSIADNISFFDPEFDQARVEECAKLAAIHDDIIATPMGYNSLVSNMGSILSGGQKQRVLLARALYRYPKILFLDEATSHLDVEREKSVNDMVRRQGITTIIVAHRPETIRSADRIIELAPPIGISSFARPPADQPVVQAVPKPASDTGRVTPKVVH